MHSVVLGPSLSPDKTSLKYTYRLACTAPVTFQRRPHSWTQLIVVVPVLYPSDFLLLVLKDLMVNRPDMKIILMSATLNANLFSEYFYNCDTIHIPGRASHCVAHAIALTHSRTRSHAHARHTPTLPAHPSFVPVQAAPFPWTSSSSKTPSPKPGNKENKPLMTPLLIYSNRC